MVELPIVSDAVARGRPAHVPVAILGGGLCGLSAAFHLGRGFELFERDDDVGGNCRSSRWDGYTFDRTGHWLHLRNEYTKQLLQDLLPGEMVAVQRRSRVYSHGVFTRYPFQSNTHGLPPDVVKDCLLGFIRAREERGTRPEPVNFEQWILYHYGEGIARHFMVPYNAKLYGLHPRQMTSLWCDRFVPKPSLEAVVAGAVGANTDELGYNVQFLYPRSGGIDHLPRALQARIDARTVHLRTPPLAVDWKRRTIHFDRFSRSYEAVVSTIPLPVLLELMEDPPGEIAELASSLTATTVRYLNVATATRPAADFHWCYAPEARLPFYRVGIYSNAVASMAPPGCGSFYVELANSGSAEPDVEALMPDVVRGMIEIGAIGSAEDVRRHEYRTIEHAYVIYDDDYWRATATILPWLEQQRIYCRGRYGAWKYTSMEDAMLEGREVAQTLTPLVSRPGAAASAVP